MGLTIQTHPDRFGVTPFLGKPDPFVVVRAFEGDAGVTLFLGSTELCDALIAAAVEARRLLDPPDSTPIKEWPEPQAAGQ